MRRSSAGLLCAAFLFVFALPGTITLSHDVTHPEGVLKLTKLKITGFEHPIAYSIILATGKKNLTAFVLDVNEDTYASTIRTIKLLKKGKVKSSGDAFKSGLIGDEIVMFSAFWVGDFKTGYGLLFVFYMMDENGEQSRLEVVQFDSSGNVTGPSKSLLTFKAGKNQILYPEGMGVGSNARGFGIFLSTRSYQDGVPTVHRAYFLETDLTGKVTSNKRAVVMPNGGKYRSAAVAAPQWNGKMWLAPLKIGKSSPEAGGGTVRSGAIVTVVPVKGTKGTLKPITIHDLTSTKAYFHYLEMLPAPASVTSAEPEAAGAVNLSLLYQKEEWLDNTGTVQDKEFTYYLQMLNGKGKKLGPPKILKMPAWNLQTTYQKYHSYYISEILSTLKDQGDGTAVFALARSMEDTNYASVSPAASKRLYEQEVSICEINPGNGTVTLRARKNTKFTGMLATPSIGIFNGKVSAIFSMWSRAANGNSTGTDFYYTLY